jgi:formylglycine-generating enzyme required for sulfatase activity
MRTVFISHATQDAQFAHRLADDLKRSGVQVWIAPGNIRPGERWVRAIDRGLAESSHMVIVLTPAALKSKWVEMETDAAIAQERKGRIQVIPLDVELCDVPPLLSGYQMVSFRRDYDAGLSQLTGILGVTPPEPVRPPHRAPPPTRKGSLIGILKAFGVSMALVLVLFVLASSIGAQPIIALAVAVVTAVLAYAVALYFGWIGRREVVFAWLTLIVVVVAGFAIWPRTMTVEGTILATAADIPILQAKVTLTDISGVSHVTFTDADGHYRFTNVPRGHYLVRAGGYKVGGGAWAVLPVRVMYTNLTVPMPTMTFTPIATAADMVRVPAGQFIMGSNEGESDEQPVHIVYLDGFYIDKTEVSNAQYRKCMETGPCDTPEDTIYYDNADYAQHPVVFVRWNDANAYCQWAGKRLPTEAEWEKAARGTGRWVYPWGNTFDGTKLNFADKNTSFDWSDSNWDDGYAATAPVGSYPNGASPYEALDMAGNVWEWVADWYDEGYYSQSPGRNPPGPDSGEYRVLRGGSWGNYRGSPTALPASGAIPGTGATSSGSVAPGVLCRIALCPLSSANCYLTFNPPEGRSLVAGEISHHCHRAAPSRPNPRRLFALWKNPNSFSIPNSFCQ